MPHHITARAPKGLLLFEGHRDYARYLAGLAEVATERQWSIRTFCLMPNHIHVVGTTPAADLGEGMKEVHERFAAWRRGVHGTHGHVFGGRFHNTLVRTPEHEIACLRYVARNPVKAGMVPAAEAWPWSAHRYLASDLSPPDFLDVDAALTGITRDAYRELVALDDGTVLKRLVIEHPDTWVSRAVDDHQLTPALVAQAIDASERTVYRRLEAARMARGWQKGDSPLSAS